MANTLRKKVGAVLAFVSLGGGAAVLSPAPAQAIPSTCYQSGETLTCTGSYSGGALDVQFVRILNPYNFGVFMFSSDGGGGVCIPAHGYFSVDPATRTAGIIVVSGGKWIPGSPVPCDP